MKQLAIGKDGDGEAREDPQDRPEGEDRFARAPDALDRPEECLPGEHRQEKGRDGDEKGDEVVHAGPRLAPVLRSARLTKRKSFDSTMISRASAAIFCEWRRNKHAKGASMIDEQAGSGARVRAELHRDNTQAEADLLLRIAAAIGEIDALKRERRAEPVFGARARLAAVYFRKRARREAALPQAEAALAA
jgi:hypothetical protein